MKTLTLDEYADLAANEPDEFLVEQFIPYPGRVLLVGPPKEGKSFLGLQLGLAVAKGEPFMGRQSRASKVLYVQYDTPHKIWMKRTAKVRSYGLTFHPNFIMLDPRESDYRKHVDLRTNLEDIEYFKLDDVAAAIVAALPDKSTFGRTLVLVGPRAYSLRELVAFTARASGSKCRIVGLPDGLSRLQARLMDRVPGKPFSSDNYRSLQTPNTSEDNSLPELGIEPRSIESVVPVMLGAAARQCRLDEFRKKVPH